MNDHGIPTIRSCERIEVICTVHYRGKGTADDVGREVTTYWSLDGARLAEDDQWAIAPTFKYDRQGEFG